MAGGPVRVQGLPKISRIAAGYLHNLAVSWDGTAWAWGLANSGQLGNGLWAKDGSRYGELAPVEVRFDLAGPSDITLQLRVGDAQLTVTRGNETTALVLDAPPEIPAGLSRTFVPIRHIIEAIDSGIEWFPDDQRVELTRDGRVVVLWIGRQTALVQGRERPIDPNDASVKPYLAPPGRTMLPLRFIAETLGADVGWDADTRTITIRSTPYRWYTTVPSSGN